MSTGHWGEVKDPVHGYIRFSELERSIFDTPPMQRLRRIRQLSATYLTYPGAEHNRFHHSLGVMHVAGLIATHLKDLGIIGEDESAKARIAGLLHDVGHGPFSHLFEEVIEKRGLTHEDFGRRIIRESEVTEVLEDHGYDASEIAELAAGCVGEGKLFIGQVVQGHFSADTMDYLVRDSYFTGVEYGRVDINRLIDSIDVLNGGLAMDVTALYALEAFVIARYEMFKAVYFHRTVRSAAVMLVRAMKQADERLGLSSFQSVDDYLKLDDSSVMAMLLGLKGDGRYETAYTLAKMIQERLLLKCAYERVVHGRDPLSVNILTHRDVRTELEREIADKAGVNPDFVAIDVSTATSVPHSAQRQIGEIPVFSRSSDGSKTPQSLSELSPLAGALIGYLDIIRVYARQEDMEAVRKAAQKIFERESTAVKISY